jgi:hypothetical protein
LLAGSGDARADFSQAAFNNNGNGNGNDNANNANNNLERSSDGEQPLSGLRSQTAAPTASESEREFMRSMGKQMGDTAADSGSMFQQQPARAIAHSLRSSATQRAISAERREFREQADELAARRTPSPTPSLEQIQEMMNKELADPRASADIDGKMGPNDVSQRLQGLSDTSAGTSVSREDLQRWGAASSKWGHSNSNVPSDLGPVNPLSPLARDFQEFKFELIFDSTSLFDRMDPLRALMDLEYAISKALHISDHAVTVTYYSLTSNAAFRRLREGILVEIEATFGTNSLLESAKLTLVSDQFKRKLVYLLDQKGVKCQAQEIHLRMRDLETPCLTPPCPNQPTPAPFNPSAQSARTSAQSGGNPFSGLIPSVSDTDLKTAGIAAAACLALLLLWQFCQNCKGNVQAISPFDEGEYREVARQPRSRTVPRREPRDRRDGGGRQSNYRPQIQYSRDSDEEEYGGGGSGRYGGDDDEDFEFDPRPLY